MTMLIGLMKKKNGERKSLNAALLGLPGAGKSYSGMGLLADFYGTWSVEKLLPHIHFRRDDFLDSLCVEPVNGAWELEMFDDAGYSLPGRKWYSDDNIRFVREIQVARKENKNMLISVPHPKLMDGGFNAVCHARVIFDYWAHTLTGKGTVRLHDIDDTDTDIKSYWKRFEEVGAVEVPIELSGAYEKQKREELKDAMADSEKHTQVLEVGAAYYVMHDHFGISYKGISKALKAMGWKKSYQWVKNMRDAYNIYTVELASGVIGPRIDRAPQGTAEGNDAVKKQVPPNEVVVY